MTTEEPADRRAGELVVVTGMMLAPIVILVTLPVLISVFSRRAR